MSSEGIRLGCHGNFCPRRVSKVETFSSRASNKTFYRGYILLTSQVTHVMELPNTSRKLLKNQLSSIYLNLSQITKANKARRELRATFFHLQPYLHRNVVCTVNCVKLQFPLWIFHERCFEEISFHGKNQERLKSKSWEASNRWKERICTIF